MKRKIVIAVVIILTIAAILLVWSQISMFRLLMSDWSAMIKSHSNTTDSLFVSGGLASLLLIVVGSLLYVVSPFCRRWIKDFFYMNH